MELKIALGCLAFIVVFPYVSALVHAVTHG